MKAKDFLYYNSLSIASVIGAVILAINDVPNWGWLIVLAVLTGVMPDSDKES